MTGDEPSFASRTARRSRSPVLICSFRAGTTAARARRSPTSFLARTWHAERFADIDPELFFDFQMTRPHVSLAERRAADRLARELLPPRAHRRPGRSRATWCSCSAPSRASAGGRSRNLITGLATDLGVSMVVTLGALLADVPHTRPGAGDRERERPGVLEQLGLQPSRYEGPTGMVGVLHDAVPRRSRSRPSRSGRRCPTTSSSLRRRAPPRRSATGSPTLLDIPVDTTELEEAARPTSSR